MLDRAFENDKIEFVWNSQIEDVFGDGSVTGIKIKNLETNESITKNVSGLFVAIGHVPNTDFLKGHVELNDQGYIECSGTKTSVDGVFVAGDVHDFRYRQAITAAGHGCEAAIDVEKYIEMNGM